MNMNKRDGLNFKMKRHINKQHIVIQLNIKMMPTLVNIGG